MNSLGDLIQRCENLIGDMTKRLSDDEYVEAMEELAEWCQSAADAKKGEG